MTTAAQRPGSGTGELRVTVDRNIARITFDNPAKRNALSVEMREALPRVVHGLQADPTVRVVVLAGAGTEAFVSGADISEFGEQRTSAEARAAYDRLVAEAAEAWASLDRPVIAMIRGWCLGAGLLTALQADIRIAAEGSRFAIPAARLGLGYARANVEALLAVAGPSWTAEILFTGRHLSATEAERIGLVNRVVPADDVEDETMALARTIAANAPLTVAAMKAALREARSAPDDRARARVDAMIEACYRSQDYLEGQRAFTEKRDPRFRGS